MTFKDLQKVIQSQSGPEQSQLLTRLRDKPFWIWSKKEHKEKDRANKGDCCFNHIIGLPRKDGVKMPLFDYEKLLYRALLERGYLNSDPLNHSSNKVKHHSFKESTCGLRKPLDWELQSLC